METQEFVEQVTGDSGLFCMMALRSEPKRRKQVFFDTAEALIAAARGYDAQGWDTYFALGRFHTDETREAGNVASMGALYLDLDCGPGKDYPDQSSAFAALRRFVRETGLPKPAVVDSGRGLHVYWPLDSSVSRAEWLPVAHRLKAACRALDFPCDPTATTDAARVLRIPGTHNHKDDPPAEVSLLMPGVPCPLADIDAALAPHAGDVSGSVLDAVSASDRDALSAHMSALLGNRTSSFRLIAEKTVHGRGCAQLAFLMSNPADVPEPLWRAGLSIAAHCEEPKAIHWISRGHPEYDPAATEEKAARIKGPYLCTSFDTLNPGVCDDCPLRGRIKSPIVLGSHIAEAEDETEDDGVPAGDGDDDADDGVSQATSTAIPPYPRPYFRGRHGGVYLKTRDANGDPMDKLIWHHDLYVVRRLIDPEAGEIIQMRHHLPKDGVRDFVVPLSVVTSKDDFRKVLAAHGVAALNKEVDAIMAYTQAWVKELQHVVAAADANRQFGWLPDHTGFVLGDRLIRADTVEYNAPSSSTRTLIPHFEPAGTLDAWKQAMAFYNRPGFELHQFVVCAGFGSALMRFTTVSAGLLHLWSKDSGYGKTTALLAALSPWGDPASLLLDERDTHLSKMLRADVMHSLPVCMDEMTNIRPADGSDLIYKITSGRQRNRMAANANVERYRGRPWNLICITSGNTSLIDCVARAKAMPKAEAQRVLEVEVSRLFSGTEGKVETDEFTRLLKDNYGHAGVPFVQYVMQNEAAVALLLQAVQNKVDKAAQLGPENRFWSAVVSAAIAAATICRQIGLLPYDVRGLFDYAVRELLGRNRSATADLDVDPVMVVAEYAYENWGRILQIKSTADRRGQRSGSSEQTVVPEQNPRIDLVGRYETDTHILFLLPRPFRDWLSDRQLSHKSVERALSDKLGAKSVRIRLTKGTGMNLPPVQTLAIPVELSDAGADGQGAAA